MRVSVGEDGSFAASISQDGSVIAFESLVSNVVADDTNDAREVFVRDLTTGVTTLISVSTGGAAGDDGSFGPQISADGRIIVFRSDATNLVAGETNGVSDIFVHDLDAGTTERVSISTGSVQSDADSFGPDISDDGTIVVFKVR